MGDMGMRMHAVAPSDSSAALGIASRWGLGQVRRRGLNQVLFKGQANACDIDGRHVRGEDIADVLPTHATKDQKDMHMRMTGQDITPGMHRQAPDVQ